MSEGSNSPDSFEDFQPEELSEAYEKKSDPQDDSLSYRTATSGTESYKTATAGEPEPLSGSTSVSQSMSSIAETLKGETEEEVEDADEVEGEKQFNSNSSWQDLEREALSVWISDHQRTENVVDEKLIKALKQRNKQKLVSIGSCKSGFINDSMRRMVWPIITDADVIETIARPSKSVIESHEFYQQVCLDVNRSLKRFPPSVTEIQRNSLQDQLVVLIMRILIQNPSYHYYQGFHDIAITFLMILGEEMSFHVLNRVCNTHLKDFMQKSMDRTSELMEIIPLLIEREDKELGEFLHRSGVGTIFALSWIITWFSHVLRDYHMVGRLFDFFLTSDPLMPIYLSAALLLYKSDQIQKLECDMSSVHQYLSRFIEAEEEDLPFERLMSEARHLISKHPSDLMIRSAEERHRMNQKKLMASRYNRRAKNYTVISIILSLLKRRKIVFTLSFLVVATATLYQYYRNSYSVTL